MVNNNPLLNRQELRKTMRAKRKQIPTTEQEQAAQKVFEQIKIFPRFLQSLNIAFYHAVKGEISLQSCIEHAIQHHKNCYLPTLDPKIKHQLSFIKYALDDALQPNRYKILEPTYDDAKLIAPTKLDIIFIPLLAFDLDGNRLGSGAGFYDATLAFLQKSPRPTRPFLVGIGYTWQKIDLINPELWDIPLDAVITEKMIYERRSP